MLIRWTPRDHLAGDVTKSPGSEKVQLLRRFSARERHLAFWVALWTAAVAAEIAVLRPVFFGRDTPVQGLEVVFRVSAARSRPAASSPGTGAPTAAAAR